MQPDFITKHKLPFESAPWELGDLMLKVGQDKVKPGEEFKLFRIGTCEGTWNSTDDSYQILAIINNKPGNGHFEDVLQWFEYSANRDKRKFRILEVWNEKLKKHLIKKRGFKAVGKDDVEK